MTAQLVPLVRLRWAMLRSERARRGSGVLAVGLVALLCGAVVAGLAAPDRRVDVVLLAPSVFLGVAVVAVLAPLVAGGGSELFPEEQLVAFPVTARTVFAGSLALTPLNLAWLTQLVGLLAVTGYLAEPSPGLVLALVTCLAYVAMVTVAGQTLGWLVVGVRQHRWGRIAATSTAVAVSVAAGVVVLTDRVGQVLDAAPTTHVVIGLANGATGELGSWARVTGLLLAGTAVLLAAGARVCDWSLRQPARPRAAGRTVRRRSQPRSALRAQLAVDRASVWRSASLRRGLLVLGVLPGIAAAAAALDWTTLVLLPGLVAAGAGLLFGVNAFALAGPGALWAESLPARAAVTFWSKALVTAEVCVVAVVVTVLAASLRATGTGPSAAEAVALLACSVVTTLRVVAVCLRLSVTRPHRADLRGPRDTPAPPGAMAVYSARLAVSTTLLALLFSAAAAVDDWRLPALLAVPFLVLSARHLLASARRWADPRVRSRVAHVVTMG